MFLKSLINSVLPKDEQIVEVTIKNPYNETDFVGDKLSVVDIKATDEKGRWYDIEIQIKEQKYYGKRAIFYLSEIYSNQLNENDSYNKLKKTIVISLLDFNYFLNDTRYFRRCCYKDFDTDELYPELDFADLYFVELRKFDKEYKNIKTTLDRWITFLNRATEIDKDNIPEELNDPEILQAINTIETMSLSAKEREYYDSEKKVMRDRDAVIQTAVEKAEEKKAIEIAKNGINAGFDNNVICKMTKLSDKQINELRKQIENE